MAVSYTIAIDKNDDGDFSDSGENITADVIALRWRLGMKHPYDSVAGPSTAEITVNNADQTYSPEHTTLQPGHRVRIQSDDGSTVRTHFTGYITRIVPEPGWGTQAVIHAEGVERELAQNLIRLVAMQDARADQVIDAVLDACTIRYPAIGGYLVIGVSGHNIIGTHKLFGAALTRDFETGKSTFSYVADTWQEGITADRAIGQAAAAERGRFYFDRSGTARFLNRHYSVDNRTVQASFDDDMTGLEYRYGEVVNRIDLSVRPRSVGEPGTVLWMLEEPMRIRPGKVRRVVARYRDDNDNSIGAITVIPPVPETDFQAAYIDKTGVFPGYTPYINISLIEAGASAARFDVWHDLGYDLYLTAFQVRGTPLYGNDPVVLEAVDAESATLYGMNRLALDLPLLTSLEEAVDLAGYELVRRKTPRGRLWAMTTDLVQHPTETLARTLFDRVSVTESQTGHSADYFIIGEEHRVDLRHCVRWLLEPVDDDTFFIIGTDKPDSSKYLIY
jgi:hypothetical protein